MPRTQEIIHVPQEAWTELTNADAEAVTWRVESGEVLLRVGSGAAPGANAPGFKALTMQGERGMPLSEFTGGGRRLWAKGLAHGVSKVFVDHADAV